MLVQDRDKFPTFRSIIVKNCLTLIIEICIRPIRPNLDAMNSILVFSPSGLLWRLYSHADGAINVDLN